MLKLLEVYRSRLNMSNPSPRTEFLAEGRGKRPKLNHVTLSVRVSPSTKSTLELIAERYQCEYGGKPWIGELLEKIGREELIIVPSPPPPCRMPKTVEQVAVDLEELPDPHKIERERVTQLYAGSLQDES